MEIKAPKVTWLWVGWVHLYLDTASPKLRCSSRGDNVRSSAQFCTGIKIDAFISRCNGQWHLWTGGVRSWDLMSMISSRNGEIRHIQDFLLSRNWKGFLLLNRSTFIWLSFVEEKKRVVKEVYLVVSQFVNQKLRSVRWPSSARKKRVLDVKMGYAHLQRLNRPTWMHL